VSISIRPNLPFITAVFEVSERFVVLIIAIASLSYVNMALVFPSTPVNAFLEIAVIVLGVPNTKWVKLIG